MVCLDVKPFSVLMSIYHKENASFFKTAMESVYNQTLKPAEIILIEDGTVGDEIHQVEELFKSRTDIELKVVPLSESHQLGRALAIGLENCSCEFVARMDTDDIAHPDRFEKQMAYLDSHPDVSAVGSDIAEFINEGNIERVKKMPSEPDEVYKYGKFRNPMNHMTVMFRKQAVLEAGNYQHFPGLEDYYLWIRMLAKGYKLANIPEVLVDARIGETFAERRGGKEYSKRYMKLRKLQHQLGYTNKFEYLEACILTLGMTAVPNQIRDKAYQLLRKK